MAENDYIFHAFSEADTAALGELLAARAQPGDVFALYGTIGKWEKAFWPGLLYKSFAAARKFPARLLRWFKLMKRRNLIFIILTYTALNLRKKFLKSALKRRFTAMSA